MKSADRSPQRGQVLPLFALALTAIVLGVAVVIDGGYAFAQRRAAQNAADFAALAGSRVVGIWQLGEPAGVGTAANVEGAVLSALDANDAELVDAQYVDRWGVALGNVVGAGQIPRGASGVVVDATVNWRPYLLGLIGVTDWRAGATATAKTDSGESEGGVMPVGVEASAYDRLHACDKNDIANCLETANLTSGRLNGPGQFGWLSFGLQGNGGKCDWEVSLGMTASGGCQRNQPFLQSLIGPEGRDPHGCCGPIGAEPNPPFGDPNSVDLIAGLTGNEWGDLSGYMDPPTVVWVPIYEDGAIGNGANAYYQIVGYGAIVFNGQGDGKQHAKWLEGARIPGLCPDYEQPPDSDKWVSGQVPGTDYCYGPGDSFTIAVSGEVELVR